MNTLARIIDWAAFGCFCTAVMGDSLYALTYRHGLSLSPFVPINWTCGLMLITAVLGGARVGYLEARKTFHDYVFTLRFGMWMLALISAMFLAGTVCLELNPTYQVFWGFVIFLILGAGPLFGTYLYTKITWGKSASVTA